MEQVSEVEQLEGRMKMKVIRTMICLHWKKSKNKIIMNTHDDRKDEY